MDARHRVLAAASLWLIAIVALYGPVLAKLGRDLTVDPNYSHGLLVAPLALLLVWQSRERLRSAAPRPSWIGLVIVAGSLALFAAGSLGAELFTTRLSLIGLIAGTIVYAIGWAHLRIVAFPIAFLIFAIPLPAIIFDRLTQSLQLVASALGENLLRTAGLPVLRDGNVLMLSTITLQVTDACSGIRSLMSLLTVTSLVAYSFERTLVGRAVVTLAAVPLAIALNGVRIAVTGIAASRFGPEVARGFTHEAAGWAIFIVALGIVWILHLALQHIGPPRPSPALEAA